MNVGFHMSVLCVYVCVLCVYIGVCVPTNLFGPNEGSFSASAVQTRTILVEMLHKCFSQLREIAAAHSGPAAE